MNGMLRLFQAGFFAACVQYMAAGHAQPIAEAVQYGVSAERAGDFCLKRRPLCSGCFPAPPI